MRGLKLSKTQQDLIDTVNDSIKKNGHGVTMMSHQVRTVNVLIKKGLIELIDSPFCSGNELIIIKKK